MTFVMTAYLVGRGPRTVKVYRHRMNVLAGWKRIISPDSRRACLHAHGRERASKRRRRALVPPWRRPPSGWKRLVLLEIVLYDARIIEGR